MTASQTEILLLYLIDGKFSYSECSLPADSQLSSIVPAIWIQKLTMDSGGRPPSRVAVPADFNPEFYHYESSLRIPADAIVADLLQPHVLVVVASSTGKPASLPAASMFVKMSPVLQKLVAAYRSPARQSQSAPAKLPVPLPWGTLSAGDFERLIYLLVCHLPGYDNVKWLTKTNAPDRGRDLSAERTFKDVLIGTRHCRVIVQCKHWTTKSVSLEDLSPLTMQMDLWEPPPVDFLIVVTSGWFTTDAAQWAETQNGKNRLQISLVAQSDLERLLAVYSDVANQVFPQASDQP